MKISFIQSNQKMPPTVLIPLWKTDDLKDILKKISQFFDLPKAFASTDWSADDKECLKVFSEKRSYLFVPLDAYQSETKLIRAFRSVIYKNKKYLPAHIGLNLEFAEAQNLVDATRLLSAGLIGLALGRYANNQFKSTAKKKKGFLASTAKVSVFSNLTRSQKTRISKEATVMAEAQRKIFDLVNKPANKKIPDTLVSLAKENSKAGYAVKVFRGAQVVKQRFHALHAVGQASPNPSAMIIMEYKPTKPQHKVAIIGKGITFDTGGVSLKPPSNMHLMKSDMGGAAAVLGTMEVVSRLKLPIHVIGVVATAENNIGSTAIKPGDIIDSYSGKTIEVINTDAEGRLVLADAIAYTNKKYKPDVMIDLATLTGSIVRALGKPAAGLFTKNAALAQDLVSAGVESGERVWPMPMWDDYFDEMKSDIADIKNLGSSPNAGSITAAKFLEYFTDDHLNWAHIDIAAQAMLDNEFSTHANATGFGIRLLVKYMKELSKK